MDEALRVIQALTRQGKTLVTAESCTGGLLGAQLTDVPGASAVYLGGVISYAYAVKTELLGVEGAWLNQFGAVCEQVACQMAEGARIRLHADYALSVTGNAGPGTDPKNANVGEIYIACASEEKTVCKKLMLRGNRQENRLESCRQALRLFEELYHA